MVQDSSNGAILNHAWTISLNSTVKPDHRGINNRPHRLGNIN